MKRFAIIGLVTLALAAPALAGVGNLGVYGDNVGSTCNITDNGGNGQVLTYIIHTMVPGDGATLSRWRIEPPAGATWNLLFFQNNPAFVIVGSAIDDLSVAYGVCQQETALLGTAFWTSSVAGPPCSWVTIKAALSQAFVLATDCNFGEVEIPKPGQAVVNPTGLCQCDIAVQPTTWGQVKALYR